MRYAYDMLGRLQTRTLETETNDYVLTYNYLAGGYGTGSTTSMISSINYNSASSLAYTYDNCGRILTVSDGTYTIHYTYDGLGQLLRTDDPTDTRGGAGGSTWSYSYDIGGNITVKKLYAHCYGDNDLSDNTVVDSFAYAYDATWKDKLTNYNGNAITYDTIGNPLTYNGWTYTWEAGRQLKQMSNGDTTLQFKYNNAGLRTQKINGSVTTNYYWAGTNISHITDGSDILHFWYEANGLPMMLTYIHNGISNSYYYQFNVQGDIIGLVDMTGDIVASYTYDSYGKLLSCTGSLADSLGIANPLRFKGYISDDETGLYYLNSRYYNPDIGRFINADSIYGKPGELLSHNLFAYCYNSPVSYADPDGHFIFTLIGAVVGFAVGAIAAVATGDDWLAGGVSGAVTGAICGAATDITIATGGAAAPLAVAVGVGFVAGAAGDFTGQVVGGLRKGKTISESVDDVNLVQVGVNAVITSYYNAGAGPTAKLAFPEQPFAREVASNTINKTGTLISPAISKALNYNFTVKELRESIYRFYKRWILPED